MEFTVNTSSAFVYTGGRPFDRELPVVVLIHGAGHDHSVWHYQARHLAHHGFSVLAPDLPGHGRSAGESLSTIEALADWVEALLDAAGVMQAALAGHSMGSLIALQTAAQAPSRITKLILLGSVAPMPVAAPLLDAARDNRTAAHTMINQWSYTPASQLGASVTPGISLTGLNLRLMERQREGLLANDLAACNAYRNGLDAAARVRAPCVMLCGERDQMTPRRAVKPLHDALADANRATRMIIIHGAGHAMMAEAPDAVSDAMRGFLKSE